MKNIGKIPPQSIDVEKIVLGAILLEKDSILEVIDILKPESFYTKQHQAIYTAVLELNNLSKPIDMVTVAQQLMQNKAIEIAGGVPYI